MAESLLRSFDFSKGGSKRLNWLDNLSNKINELLLIMEIDTIKQSGDFLDSKRQIKENSAEE